MLEEGPMMKHCWDAEQGKCSSHLEGTSRRSSGLSRATSSGAKDVSTRPSLIGSRTTWRRQKEARPIRA